MGATSFDHFERAISTDDTSKAAFNRAVEEAREENGTGGYSGTIAEKHKFTTIGTCATLAEARDMAYNLIDEDDRRISDKWGPAGCIAVEEPRGWLFFGMASS